MNHIQQSTPDDGRGTDAQIERERDIARHAIVGALAAGYAGAAHPGAEHWLAAAHDAGARIKALEAAAHATPESVAINYTPGTWYEVKTHDELEAFFLSRLPAIREAAREHGYAIGLHGSLRRDMDLIAVPWSDGASDKDALAHAIAIAAVGLTRNGAYQWEVKPSGRVATSLSCCWTPWPDVAGSGHIDLSVISPSSAHAVPTAWPTARDVGRYGDMSPEAHLRVGLDSDNDVFVSVSGDRGTGSVEFCNGAGGGGSSMRTREALIALMVAIEADNAKRPDKDFWKRRG